MDPVLSTYLFLFILIIVINVIPAFMPASWMVLAFFTIAFHLNVPAVVLLGVTASTIGRTGLYFLANRYIARFLSAKQNANMTSLGEFLNRRHILFWLVAAFSFLPLPSNHIYIAAGLARFNFRLLTASFIIGRTIDYALLVGGSNLAFAGVSELLTKSVTSPAALAIQLAGLVLLVLIIELDWRKILRR